MFHCFDPPFYIVNDCLLIANHLQLIFQSSDRLDRVNLISILWVLALYRLFYLCIWGLLAPGLWNKPGSAVNFLILLQLIFSLLERSTLTKTPKMAERCGKSLLL